MIVFWVVVGVKGFFLKIVDFFFLIGEHIAKVEGISGGGIPEVGFFFVKDVSFAAIVGCLKSGLATGLKLDSLLELLTGG